MPVCEIDLRPGGAWHFLWRRSDGAEMEMRGGYREVKPPERLVSTESWGGNWPETLNTLLLSEQNGKTTVTNTVLYPSKQARDAALKEESLRNHARNEPFRVVLAEVFVLLLPVSSPRRGRRRITLPCDSGHFPTPRPFVRFHGVPSLCLQRTLSRDSPSPTTRFCSV